jgi:opacity protein-like surface antigen
VQRLIAAFLGLIFFGLLSTSVFAQKLEVFVGGSDVFSPVSVKEQVSYCPVLGTCSVPGTIYTNREGLLGFEVSATHHFTSRLALTADAGGNYGLATSGFQRNARVRQHTIMGGPQFSGSGRVSPFVHVLVGAAHQSTTASGNNFFVTFPGSEWGLAAAVGGGINAKITPNFTFRIIQADYMVTQLGGRTQSQPRLSAGFVFHF